MTLLNISLKDYLLKLHAHRPIYLGKIKRKYKIYRRSKRANSFLQTRIKKRVINLFGNHPNEFSI